MTRDRLGREVLLELCVFRLGSLQDGDFGIGVFPKSQKVLVGGAGLACVALERSGPRYAKMCQRAQREIEHNPGMLHHLLELRGRFFALVGFEVCLSAKVNGICHPQRKGLTFAQLIRRCGLQDFHSSACVLCVERNGGVDRRQPVTLQDRILGEILA